MRVYRIAPARLSKTRREAFSGKGGLNTAGRWNSAGMPVVYASQSLSLAALEVLVHLKQTNGIQPFLAFCADVPDACVQRPASYPERVRNDFTVSRAFGDDWLASRKSAALLVPSIVTPGEWNVLLNPIHPDFSLAWVSEGPRPYAFDTRLLHRSHTRASYEAEWGTPATSVEESCAAYGLGRPKKRRR